MANTKRRVGDNVAGEFFVDTTCIDCDTWDEQTRSMESLLSQRFEWILPGHGDRVRLPQEEMRRQLAHLLETMRSDH